MWTERTHQILIGKWQANMQSPQLNFEPTKKLWQLVRMKTIKMNQTFYSIKAVKSLTIDPLVLINNISNECSKEYGNYINGESTDSCYKQWVLIDDDKVHTECKIPEAVSLVKVCWLFKAIIQLVIQIQCWNFEWKEVKMGIKLVEIGSFTSFYRFQIT